MTTFRWPLLLLVAFLFTGCYNVYKDPLTPCGDARYNMLWDKKDRTVEESAELRHLDSVCKEYLIVENAKPQKTWVTIAAIGAAVIAFLLISLSVFSRS